MVYNSRVIRIRPFHIYILCERFLSILDAFCILHLLFCDRKLVDITVHIQRIVCFPSAFNKRKSNQRTLCTQRHSRQPYIERAASAESLFFLLFLPYHSSVFISSFIFSFFSSSSYFPMLSRFFFRRNKKKKKQNEDNPTVETFAFVRPFFRSSIFNVHLILDFMHFVVFDAFKLPCLSATVIVYSVIHFTGNPMTNFSNQRQTFWITGRFNNNSIE